MVAVPLAPFDGLPLPLEFPNKGSLSGTTGGDTVGIEFAEPPEPLDAVDIVEANEKETEDGATGD